MSEHAFPKEPKSAERMEGAMMAGGPIVARSGCESWKMVGFGGIKFQGSEYWEINRKIGWMWRIILLECYNRDS